MYHVLKTFSTEIKKKKNNRLKRYFQWMAKINRFNFWLNRFIWYYCVLFIIFSVYFLYHHQTRAERSHWSLSNLSKISSKDTSAAVGGHEWFSQSTCSSELNYRIINRSEGGQRGLTSDTFSVLSLQSTTERQNSGSFCRCTWNTIKKRSLNLYTTIYVTMKH